MSTKELDYDISTQLEKFPISITVRRLYSWRSATLEVSADGTTSGHTCEWPGGYELLRARYDATDVLSTSTRVRVKELASLLNMSINGVFDAEESVEPKSNWEAPLQKFKKLFRRKMK